MFTFQFILAGFGKFIFAHYSGHSIFREYLQDVVRSREALPSILCIEQLKLKSRPVGVVPFVS